MTFDPTSQRLVERGCEIFMNGAWMSFPLARFDEAVQHEHVVRKLYCIEWQNPCMEIPTPQMMPREIFHHPV